MAKQNRGPKSRKRSETGEENNIIGKINNLGVNNPLRPNSKDIKIILDAYIKKKKLNATIFNSYIEMVNPALRTIFEGLTEFSNDSKEVSTKVMNIINNAIEILGAELKSGLVKSKEERILIRNHIIELVEQARKESRDYIKVIFMLVTAGIVAMREILKYFQNRKSD